MISSVYYVLRSRQDGNYLVARLGNPDTENIAQYILVFSEHHEALSYLNAHAPDVASQFGVESLSASQLKGVLSRWGFQGMGMVKDPLEPRIEFMS
jgi:hypothetical protein